MHLKWSQIFDNLFRDNVNCPFVITVNISRDGQWNNPEATIKCRLLVTAVHLLLLHADVLTCTVLHTVPNLCILFFYDVGTLSRRTIGLMWLASNTTLLKVNVVANTN